MAVEKITINADATSSSAAALHQAMEERGYTNVELTCLTLSCTAPDGSQRHLTVGSSLERWQLGQQELESPFTLTIDHTRMRADAMALAEQRR